MLQRRKLQTNRENITSVWNKFKRATAGLVLATALATGSGCKENEHHLPEPIATIETVEARSVLAGEAMYFKVSAQNIRPNEEAKAALFLISPDTGLFYGQELPLKSDNNNSAHGIAGFGGGRGIYLAAAKLMEPRDSNWTFVNWGVRPDIPSPPEGLLTFETADWSDINAELNTRSLVQIELPLPSVTIPLTLETPRLIGDSEDVYFISARGRENTEIRGGITIDGETSAGFIMLPGNQLTPPYGGPIYWHHHIETGLTIIFRSVDEIIDAYAQSVHSEQTSTRRCVPEDEIYRVNVYYDSTLNLYKAINSVEQAKIHLEALGKNIVWSGPWARSKLDNRDATIDETFDEFLSRSDMEFPGCRDGDFKIFMGNDMSGGRRIGQMIIVGDSDTAQRSGEVLAHEIGHFFGARHDCRAYPSPPNPCLGFGSSAERELDCEDIPGRLGDYCRMLAFTPMEFSIMFNYNTPLGCVEGCSCGGGNLCDEERPEHLWTYILANFGGCVSTRFSDQSFCEIENSWRDCDGINEDGCLEGEVCNSANQECRLSDCIEVIEDCGEECWIEDFDGEHILYRAEGGLYFEEVRSGRGDLLEFSGRSRVSGGRVVSGFDVHNVAAGETVNVEDSILSALRSVYGDWAWFDRAPTSWDIHGGTIVYEGFMRTPNRDYMGLFRSGGFDEIGYPDGYSADVPDGWPRIEDSRIAMLFGSASASDLFVYAGGRWEFIDNFTHYWDSDPSPDFDGYGPSLSGDAVVFGRLTNNATSGEVFSYDIPSGALTALPIEFDYGLTFDLDDGRLAYATEMEAPIRILDIDTGDSSIIVSNGSVRYLMFENNTLVYNTGTQIVACFLEEE
ncbi:MAG: hypothetical protein ABH983_03665 [Candidatus Micrarchaeota archaeon]